MERGLGKGVTAAGRINADAFWGRPLSLADGTQGVGSIREAMAKLWATLPPQPKEMIFVADRRFLRTLDAVSAEMDARTLWEAKGANWRRVKREGNRAYRAAWRAAA